MISEVSFDRRGIAGGGRAIVADAGSHNFDGLPGTQGAAALDKRLDPVAEPEDPRPPG